MMHTEMNESSGQIRDVNINIRAKRTQRDLIDHAADLLGKSRSDFMLETACLEATDVILDQRVFLMGEEAFAKFQALLDAPSRENPRLHKLMETRAPWES